MWQARYLHGRRVATVLTARHREHSCRAVQENAGDVQPRSNQTPGVVPQVQNVCLSPRFLHTTTLAWKLAVSLPNAPQEAKNVKGFMP